MATGTLSPNPIQTIWDVNGDPVSGAKLFVYYAGTSTPAPTWLDSNLIPANQNPNPIIANAAGQYVIYLAPGTSYKYIATTSDGTPLWTRDNVGATGAVSVQSNNIAAVSGRLTLQSGVPVPPPPGISGASTLYFTPYAGNNVAIFDGNSWQIYAFSELNLSLAGWTANKNSDIFIHADNGIPTLERQEWTSDTARPANLTLQDGVLTRSGVPTRRYLGTVRTTTSTGQTEDTATTRFVWNYYNRRRRVLLAIDTTDSWSYTAAFWRIANNNPLNKVNIVCGLPEDAVDLTVWGLGLGGGGAGVGIGMDTITAVTYLAGITPSSSNLQALQRMCWFYPTEGYHYFAWMEFGQPGVTFYGDAGLSASYGVQFGLGGTWWS